MFLCLIVVQVLFVFGIDQNKNKVNIRMTKIEWIVLFSDKLSNYLDSSWLFPSRNIFLDVCRWNRIINRVKTCFQNRSNTYISLFIIFLRFSFTHRSSLINTLSENWEWFESIVRIHIYDERIQFFCLVVGYHMIMHLFGHLLYLLLC